MTKKLFYIALGLTMLLDFVTPVRDHPVFWYHHVPAFDAIVGLAGALLLIKGSKALAKHWLQRQEDYYD